MTLLAIVVLTATTAGQPPSDTLPESALPLRLVGVAIDASAPARSAGLIQCGLPGEKRAARFVAVGGQACDVAEVREVREQGVVIRNLATNRLERLRLPPAGRTTTPPAHPAEAVVEDTERDEIPPPVVLPGSPDVVMVELRRELLQRYLSNLPEVLSAALATPHYTTGASGATSIDGYQVSQIRAGGIVEQLGLQDGDVLAEFDGRKLDSLGAVTGLFAQVPSMSGGRLVVYRQGARITFVITVR